MDDMNKTPEPNDPDPGPKPFAATQPMIPDATLPVRTNQDVEQIVATPNELSPIYIDRDIDSATKALRALLAASAVLHPGHSTGVRQTRALLEGLELELFKKQAIGHCGPGTEIYEMVTTRLALLTRVASDFAQTGTSTMTRDELATILASTKKLKYLKQTTGPKPRNTNQPSQAATSWWAIRTAKRAIEARKSRSI